jgi:hypothetical protein
VQNIGDIADTDDVVTITIGVDAQTWETLGPSKELLPLISADGPSRVVVASADISQTFPRRSRLPQQARQGRNFRTTSSVSCRPAAHRMGPSATQPPGWPAGSSARPTS